MSEISDNGSLEAVSSNDRFRTTQWQLIRSAGDDSEEGVRHLDRLLRRYLPALAAFLMRRYRFDKATAEDLLQTFIIARFLHGRLLELANPERGRFRTILLAALTNHVRMEIRKQRATKRISTLDLLNLDEVTETDLEQSSPSPDEAILEPSLNRQIVGEAVRKFRQHCDQRGKLIMWEVFENRLLKPMMDDVTPEPYERLAVRLRLKSQSQATNLLMSGKRSFIHTLRTVIDEFALNVSDAELELDSLRKYYRLDFQ